MKNIFELLNLEIDGSVIVTELMNNWISFFGTEKNKIEKIEVLLYEDYSGIFDASIILSDSTKIKFNEPEIDKIINNLIKKEYTGYEVLHWLLDPKEDNQNKGNIVIEECNINIIAMKIDQKVESPLEAFDLIIEIIDFIECDYYMSFYYESFFKKGSYPAKLLRLISVGNRLDLIDQLMFKDYLINSEARKAIAQRAIYFLNDPLSDEQEKLVVKLIEDQKLLNGYLKDRLKSNFTKKRTSLKIDTVKTIG